MSFSSKPGKNLSADRLKLLNLLIAEEGMERPSELQDIPRRPAGEPLPLSYAQQRLWFLDQLEPNSHVYNIVSAARLRGKLDGQVMLACLEEIVRRHESLRTNFRIQRERPVQVITAPGPFQLSQVDLCQIPEVSREVKARLILDSEARKPFNLSQDLFLRAILIKMTEDEHILVITTNHIAADGWSLGIISHELTSLYTAYVQGQPSPLSELKIQYADFSLWQNQQLHGDYLEQELTFWKDRLSGSLPILDLPTDQPRPALQSFKGSRAKFDLSLELWEELKNLSRRENVTLFMTLFAAFAVLLYKYTGQEDILVGSPVAGRNLAELEPLIGFFANNLVLRVDLSGNPSFLNLLSRIRQITLDAISHQELPFQFLVDSIHPERDLSRMPFFQVMFSLQNMPFEELSAPGLIYQPILVDAGISRFDLTIEIWELEKQVWIFAEYNTDLFEPATIELLMGHYQTLISSLLADPTRLIGDLSILTDEELQHILKDVNDTKMDVPQCPIRDLFEAQSVLSSNLLAASFGEHALTYSELNSRANQLAHHLRSLGAGPDVLVAIYLERSVEMVIGLLAILKSGSAYLPLDPIYPSERLEFMLQDSGALILLTEEKLLGSISRCKAQPVCIDADWPAVCRESTDNPVVAFGPDNLAYVIYTSGSTGRPKGVQVLQRGVVNFLKSMQHEPGISSRDILLSVTTLSFDIAGLEILLPLVSGALVVIVSSEVASDGLRLAEAIHQNRATMMQATPATWQMLVSTGWKGTSGLKVLCGGDSLSAELAVQLLERSASVWNLYGPTETTIWSTIYPISSKEQPVAIGRPIANTRVYIVDTHLQPVPFGVPGELLIGGYGLAKGYLNQPELTAEKFIPDPFSMEPGARLYRTGDLARLRRDGNIEFLGRIDHQVKIRGFRIELGEIEAVLSEHPSIQQVVVIPHNDSPGSKRLIAYIMVAQQPVPTVSELRQYLGNRLPEYMVPAVFVFLESFPLTTNGKVDRRHLPPPEGNRPDLGSNFVSPRNETERSLSAIWQELLNLKQVGAEDNFFELGGHSLLATQLMSRLDESFHINLPLRTIFETPTLAGLAERIETILWAAQGRPAESTVDQENREELEF